MLLKKSAKDFRAPSPKRSFTTGSDIVRQETRQSDKKTRVAESLDFRPRMFACARTARYDEKAPVALNLTFVHRGVQPVPNLSRRHFLALGTVAAGSQALL